MLSITRLGSPEPPFPVFLLLFKLLLPPLAFAQPARTQHVQHEWTARMNGDEV